MVDVRFERYTWEGLFVNVTEPEKRLIREVVKADGGSLAKFSGMEGYTASERAVFVIDKEGVIKFKWVGENPGVQPDYDEVQRQVDALN